MMEIFCVIGSIKDVKKTFTKEDFAGEGLLVKRGKKNFCKVKSE